VTISQLVVGTVRTLTAHALRPVAAGDELCISYSEAKLLDNTQARRAWLQRTYVFECQCALCQAPPAEAREMVREFNKRYGFREECVSLPLSFASACMWTGPADAFMRIAIQLSIHFADSSALHVLVLAFGFTDRGSGFRLEGLGRGVLWYSSVSRFLYYGRFRCREKSCSGLLMPARNEALGGRTAVCGSCHVQVTIEAV
jgi:hypothetical protein